MPKNYESYSTMEKPPIAVPYWTKDDEERFNGRWSYSYNFEEFEERIKGLLGLKKDLDDYAYTLFSMNSSSSDFADSTRPCRTPHTTSLAKLPNPIFRSFKEMFHYILNLKNISEYIVQREGLDESAAISLLFLTSTWDKLRHQPRSKLGFTEQLQHVKNGFHWEAVVAVEAEGIPLEEWELAKDLPDELRGALYKARDRNLVIPGYVEVLYDYGTTPSEFAAFS